MEEEDKNIQRTDAEANSAIIRLAYLQILNDKNGRRPTVAELSEKTELHANTIKKHLKHLSFRDLSEDLGLSRLLTDDVILSIYQAATEDRNVPAMKLWLQVVEGFSERTETKIDAKVQTVNRPPVIIHIGRRSDEDPE